MRTLIAISAALALTATSALAAEPPLNCSNAQSNLEMKMCAQRDFEAADKELNAVFTKAVAEARAINKDTTETVGGEKMPNLEQKLRATQRSWMAYRDGNCEYQSLMYWGGTHASLAYSLCMVDMTKSRTKELKDTLNGGQGEEETK